MSKRDVTFSFRNVYDLDIRVNPFYFDNNIAALSVAILPIYERGAAGRIEKRRRL
ncbi:MAG: hypothetical protein M3P08_02865 [Thermoproteota archaeon]|nr:hypothetical protein [Thermoproteota archaeon]